MYMDVHCKLDDDSSDNNSHLYNPPPNRSHIVHLAQQLHYHIWIVLALKKGNNENFRVSDEISENGKCLSFYEDFTNFQCTSISNNLNFTSDSFT